MILFYQVENCGLSASTRTSSILEQYYQIMVTWFELPIAYCHQ
jgi:hypothetical protein